MSISIFQKPFWLDTVAPGKWQYITINNGKDVKAMMPIVSYKDRRGNRLITMPPLTQTLGPWITSQSGKYVTKLSNQHELFDGLIDQLPYFDYFRQKFHYSITNWLPFYWRGFKQTTFYTYVIEEISDPDKVWSEIRQTIRTNIRKAKRNLSIRSDLGVEKFLELNHKTFTRLGVQLPYDDVLVRRIYEACENHECQKIFFAEDSGGRIHAAIYVIWDENAAYYLMGGADPELRNSGATSFLLWEAILFASTVTKSFDFEGSMLQPVERFFRGFGARQMPYLEISKINSLSIKMKQDIHSWWRIWHG